MPPPVITSSPTLSEPSMCWRVRSRCRCGRMSKKYMKANSARRTRKKPLPTRNLLAEDFGGLVEAVERGRLVRGELSPLDRRPGAGRQIEQKADVVLGQKYQAEQLLLVQQMTEVGPAEAAASRAPAAVVERARVTGEARVLEVEAALPRERGTRAPQARGQHAIEHVDPALDHLEDAGGIADAHEVARLVDGEERRRPGDGLQHEGAVLPHAEPAERVPVEVELGDLPDRAPAKIVVGAALRDAEKELARAAWRPSLAPGPRRRRRGREREFGERDVGRRADVEAHGDVGAETALDVGDELRRKTRRLPVVDRPERDPILVDGGDRVTEREDLKAARVREDGAAPAHEAVKAAELLDHVDARTEVEVVGIAKEDRRPELLQSLGVEAFDARLRTHRHEGRGGHVAVCGVEEAGARLTLGGGECESHDIVSRRFRLVSCATHAFSRATLKCGRRAGVAPQRMSMASPKE